MRETVAVRIVAVRSEQRESVPDPAPIELHCPVCRRYLGTAQLDPLGWVKVKCQGCNQWRRIERQTA